MMNSLIPILISALLVFTAGCKKKSARLQGDCVPEEAVIGQVKDLDVKVSVVLPGDLCEVVPVGSTDTRYYVCNMPEIHQEKGKQLKVSGVVKSDQQNADVCCVYRLVLTSVSAD